MGWKPGVKSSVYPAPKRGCHTCRQSGIRILDTGVKLLTVGVKTLKQDSSNDVRPSQKQIFLQQIHLPQWKQEENRSNQQENITNWPRTDNESQTYFFIFFLDWAVLVPVFGPHVEDLGHRYGHPPAKDSPKTFCPLFWADWSALATCWSHNTHNRIKDNHTHIGADKTDIK